MTSWCKLPWQRWHWVHKRENRISRSLIVTSCFWYNSPARGIQFGHTASFTPTIVSTTPRPKRGFVGVTFGQGSFAAETGLSFDGKFHESSNGGGSNTNRPSMISRHYTYQHTPPIIWEIQSKFAFSWRIGSKIRKRGFESWFSR